MVQRDVRMADRDPTEIHHRTAYTRWPIYITTVATILIIASPNFLVNVIADQVPHHFPSFLAT